MAVLALQKKNLVLTSVQAKTKFFLSLHNNVDSSYLFVRTKIYKIFMTIKKVQTFLLSFV